MRGTLIAVTGSLLLAACGGTGPTSTEPGVTTYSGSHSASAKAPTPKVATSTPSPAAGLACETAPQKIVAMIDAAFTGGEHLEDAQAIDGAHAMTYVGANIFGADGEKASSQDTWVLLNGNVYALTSDARRRTLLPDGRDLPQHDMTWTDYNDQVSKCVGDVERARNQGR